MKYEFHPEAFREYAHAVSRYEERQRGLGGRFIQSVEIALTAFAKHLVVGPCWKRTFAAG